MCDLGITGIMAGIAIASSLTSTALGVVGSAVQGSNEAAQQKYQEAVNRDNARIASEKAAQERQKGLEDARWQRIKNLQTIGDKKVALASSGSNIGYGSNLDIIEDTAMMGELDALMIENNSEQRAQSYEISANSYLSGANMNSFKASASKGLNALGAASSVTKGFGTLNNKADALYKKY